MCVVHHFCWPHSVIKLLERFWAVKCRPGLLGEEEGQVSLQHWCAQLFFFRCSLPLLGVSCVRWKEQCDHNAHCDTQVGDRWTWSVC